MTGPSIVPRYLHDALRRFAAEKYVLLSGPRQVGKTTLAREWLRPVGGLYLNWDVPGDRERILRRDFLDGAPPVALVLDELHKYPRWKAWLKGLYDRPGPRIQVVVTGSARLDIYQRGGDSLLGRHERLRLHPLSVGEVLRPGGPAPAPPADWLHPEAGRHAPAERPAGAGLTHAGDAWERLMRFGGFPEPWMRTDAAQHRRWVTRRRSLLVREDLRDLTQIRQLALVEHLALLLPDRVGAPLSVNALREDLQVGHDTVSSWLDALDLLYFAFRVPPYAARVARAITKERKLYLWDWSEVRDAAARLENLVASHLLKAVHLWNDLGHGEFDLRYVRDKEGREVDFVVTESRRPQVLVEVKLADQPPTAALRWHQERLGRVPAVQLVGTPGVDRTHASARTRVVTAATWLSGLV